MKKNKIIEPEATAVFKAIIPNCEFFIDVGAEHGYYTKMAMKRMTKGNIIAIEPEAARFEKLQGNVANNQKNKLNIKIVNACVGDHDGFITLYTGSTPSVMKGNGEIKKRLLNAKVRSPLYTLDTLVGDEPVDIMKIDVEGYELGVLKGCNIILENRKPQILLELHPSFLRLNGEDPKEVFDILDKYGYNYELIVRRENDVTGNVVEQYICT